MNEINWEAGAAWMKGELIPVSQASVPVTDWGLTHSDITYDVVHVWDGKFFRLDDYLLRFENSLRKCRLSVEQSRQDMRHILHQIVARSGLRYAYVSFVASRGQPLVAGCRDPRECANHFYAWCVPFVWVFTEDVIERGVRLHVDEQVRRIEQHAVDPTAKNYHWGDFTRALFAAKDAGFDNTLLLDERGNLTEGPGFNIFIIQDGIVYTPRSGVLEGITRQVAMEICAANGVTVQVTDVSLDQALQADELFATTTGGGIIPVTRINNHVFSNDAPGEITSRLRDSYWQLHNDPAMSEAVCY